MAATIFVIVWSMVGFYMVLFVAAIKGIPAETVRGRPDRRRRPLPDRDQHHHCR